MALPDEKKLFQTFPLYPDLPFPQITARKSHVAHSNATEKNKNRESKEIEKGKEAQDQCSFRGGATR